MSVGTIVTIVLLMSVLILGLFLVRNIFSSAGGAIEMTDQQLQAEIGKLFGAEDAKLVIYPTSEYLLIKANKQDAVGIGIRNIASGFDESTSFSYDVVFLESTCGIIKPQAEKLISLGKTRENVDIGISQFSSMKVRFQIPEGIPNCQIEYKVTVKKGSEIYATSFFTLETKA